MTKRKRNILFVALAVILIILTASVGIVYAAYNTVIDHNYKFTAHADMLLISADGNTVKVTKRGGTALTATKSDIILISQEGDGDITLDGIAASKYVAFEIGQSVYRKSVFIDMRLDLSPTTAFYASAAVTGLKAVISEATYGRDESYTVKYDNIFIGSELDFELMNFHSNYNNISELRNNYHNKEISSRTVYLLTDIYITKNYTVNIPCSINLLDSRLIIGKDASNNLCAAALKLAHSYSGAYYISAITEQDYITVNSENLAGNIVIEGDSGFTVNAPKAYYQIDNSLADFVTVINYSADYTPLLVADALAFAAEQIPDKFHSSIILQQRYQTYGIKYSYDIISGEGGSRIAEFNGTVSAANQTGETRGLVRGLNTASHWIRIYAIPKSGTQGYIDKEVRLIGSGEAAMLQNILENITNAYYNSVNERTLRLDIDLLGVLKNEYEAGGFSGDITVSVYENEFLENDITTQAGRDAELAVIKNATAVRLVLHDGTKAYSSRSFTVGLNNEGQLLRKDMGVGVVGGGSGIGGGGVGDGGGSGGSGSGDEISYLIINKGITTLSDKLYIKLSSTNVAASSVTTREYDLSVSTRQEVTYYIRSLLTSFTTNRAYHVINLRAAGADKGIYCGTEKLVYSLLGLKDIVNRLVFRIPLDEEDAGSLVTETLLTDSEVSERFDYNAETQSYKSKSARINVKYVWLKYTFLFDDNTEEIIYLPIIKSLSDDGGENQEFESSNPFDELFMSSETAWVNGGVFYVPEDKPFHYGYIEIVSINGKDYSQNSQQPLDKMARIEYDEEQSHDTFYVGVRPVYSGVDRLNTKYYKTVRFVTNRDYVPDYNVSVRVRCWYLNSSTPDIVLTQDYVIIIPGIFKCYSASSEQPPADATPHVFTDRSFYDLTMDLFFENHLELYASYVSEFVNWNGESERILLSDSSYATVNLDYSRLLSTGSGVDIEGIQRLKNVVSIRLDNIEVSNTRAFSKMADSALEYLYLKNCKMTDNVLYDVGASQSYLYNLHLKEVDLSENALVRNDRLLSRTVTWLDLSHQRNGSIRCLTDISGLGNLTGLQTLNVSDNGILRFEVLSILHTLKTVYVYDNIVSLSDSELYGTDGRINIPYYVAAIKNSDTRIHADSANIAGYIKIDRGTDNSNRYSVTDTGALSDSYIASDYTKFSDGGDISAEQEEGGIVLNAFASPTRIYSKNAVFMLMYELFNLKISAADNDIWEGDVGSDNAYYKYMFYNPYGNGDKGTLSQTEIAFIDKNGAAVAAIGTVGSWSIEGDIVFSPNNLDSGHYSYIVAVLDPNGNIIAFREFAVEILSLS